MGRSEPGGEKERELARMATMVIAARRREGRQANDWRTFNEKTIKQAKTGLFIQNLCETEHPGDHDSREFLSLNPEEIWGICTRWPSVTLVGTVEVFSAPLNVGFYELACQRQKNQHWEGI